MRGREFLYELFEREVLGRGDSERWHNRARRSLDMVGRTDLGLWLLGLMVNGRRSFQNSRLGTQVGEVELLNPVMVGAGWSKNAEAIAGLTKLGFSAVVVGTVVPRPQAGNEKPRQWGFEGGVGFNRNGFANLGMEAVAGRLERLRENGFKGVIGVSVGRNKETSNGQAVADYVTVARRLKDVADLVEVNISSPNTEGLRDLQKERAMLKEILCGVKQAVGEKPVLVKVAPLGDISKKDLNLVIEVVEECGLAGIVAVNTTVSERIKGIYGVGGQMGGMSGADPEYRRMALETVAHIHKVTNGEMPIIGAGGVSDPESAVAMLEAGASALQVVTGIRGRGPMVAGIINQGLIDRMNQEGISNIAQMVGRRPGR
jgi:dihydroorotate dehydrogenase